MHPAKIVVHEMNCHHCRVILRFLLNAAPKYSAFAGGQKWPNMSRFYLRDVPAFADIADVESVYRQILDLRERASKESGSEKGNTG